MKWLLCFLMLIVSLTSCETEKKNFQLIQRGEIAKIENQKIASINGIGYSVDRGLNDFFLGETLAVGDTVNVYTNEDIIVLSKLDYSQVVPPAKEMDWVFTAIERHPWRIALSVLLVLSLIFAFIAFCFDCSFRSCFKFALGGIAVLSFGYLLSLPTFEYQQNVRIESVSASNVTVQGRAYPKKKVYNFNNLRAQSTYLMYKSGNKVYFAKPSFFTSQNPEILAKAINREVRFYALLVFYISSVWSFFWCIPWGKILKKIKIFMVSLRSKKRYMKSSIDSQGGLGSF